MKNFYHAILLLLISCGTIRGTENQRKYYVRSSQFSSYIFIFNQSGNGEIYDWGGSLRGKTVFDWKEIDKEFVLFHKFDPEEEIFFSTDTLVLKGRFLLLKSSQKEHGLKSKLNILPPNLKLEKINQKRFNRKYREFVEKGF